MEQALVLELVKRLEGRAMLSSDVSDSDLEGHDLEALTAQILKFFEGKDSARIVKKETLRSIIGGMASEKVPVQVEVIRKGDFEPAAKEVKSKFTIKNRKAETVTSTTATFADYFNDRFHKLKRFLETSSNSGMLNNIEALKNYTNGREVTVAGIVYDKITTRNGHVMVTLEDESGTTKVLFLKPGNPAGRQLFESAQRIIFDDVLAVRGRVSSPFVIANSIAMPDLPIHERKATEEDIAIAFLSDTHVGSRFFLEKQFANLIRWLNGSIDYRKDLAGKIKYLIVSGDVADGIGTYPEQEKELVTLDIFKQYSTFFDMTNSLPDYIEMFASPGNHDAVQAAMPQPELTKELTGELKRNGTHVMTNPAYLNLHGLSVLASHGTSLDNVIANVPSCSYLKPETAMVEVLRRRHLAPVYGGNIIVPSRNDPLVIDEVPDILHMGHVHKNGYAEYHGTLIVNSGTWQAKTDYQAKRGHLPSPGVLPVYETKTGKLTEIDFNTIG